MSERDEARTGERQIFLLGAKARDCESVYGTAKAVPSQGTPLGACYEIASRLWAASCPGRLVLSPSGHGRCGSALHGRNRVDL